MGESSPAGVTRGGEAEVKEPREFTNTPLIDFADVSEVPKSSPVALKR